MDQVTPIHSILTILQVKEMASTLEQLKGNCLDLVSLLHVTDAPLGVAFLENYVNWATSTSTEQSTLNQILNRWFALLKLFCSNLIHIHQIEFEFQKHMIFNFVVKFPFWHANFLFPFDVNLVYNAVSMTGFLMKINYSILGIYMILNTSLNSKDQSLLRIP